MNFSIKDYFSKCEQVLNRKLYLLRSVKNVKYYNESQEQCPDFQKDFIEKKKKHGSFYFQNSL